MRALLTTLAMLLAGSAPAQATAKPGPEHEQMKKLEGTWDAVIKGAGGESKGLMKIKMKHGGLWMQSNFEGDIGTGTPYTGTGLDTYDSRSKKYVTVWVDSLSPSPMILEGTHDAATKKTTQIAERAEGPDGKPAKWKSVTHYIDDDHMDFAMYIVAAAGDQEMMSIKYTRRKK